MGQFVIVKVKIMYNLLLSCCIYLAISLPQLTKEVGDVVILLKTADLEVSLDSPELSEFFLSAEFEPVEQNLIIETKENIHSILIYNGAGEMEFMLPVMAAKVTLGRSMFDSGKYRLGFNFENFEELTYANVAMN